MPVIRGGLTGGGRDNLMGENMRQGARLKTGKLPDTITRGPLSMPRSAGGPRRHAASDPRFDREIAGIYASWKAVNGDGPYASRPIANVAHDLGHPARVIDGHLEAGVLAGVPLERLKELGRAMIRRVDVLAARHGKLKPAA